MLKLENMGGKLTAIYRGAAVIDPADLTGVKALWIERPEPHLGIAGKLNSADLEHLHLQDCNVPITEIATTETLRRLKWLIIANSPRALCNANIKMDLLERLYVRGQHISSSDSDFIRKQPSVISLSITATDATDDTLLGIASYKTLRRLDLWKSKVSFNCESYSPSAFPNVRSLDVSSTEVCDKSVKYIERAFPALERFIATCTQITRSGIESISGWPKLQILATGTPGLDFDKHNKQFWEL